MAISRVKRPLAKLMKGGDAASWLALCVSILSLAVASVSLVLSYGTEKRNSEQFISAMTAVLTAELDPETDSLAFETSEESKTLSYGLLYFPEVFFRDPLSFRSPENDIVFAPIEEKATEVLRAELAAIYAKDSGYFPEDAAASVDLAIPVYVESKTTAGGTSVESRAAYTLGLVCWI